MALIDIEIEPTDRDLSAQAARFLAAARSRFETVDCFSFVPSDYELFWRTVDALPRGRFCEWGSGFGAATGLAEFLGFAARGIEEDAGLVAASRRLLAEFQLSAEIDQGNYFEFPCDADVVFVYCWPSRIGLTEDYFERNAPEDARLMICYGQSDIRVKAKTHSAK